MRELQDMLRVQARLHRKQGANALGYLLENAGKEIESLSEQLAKANESALFYKEQYEKTDRECTKLAMRESKANEREKRLEKILQRYESEQLQPLKQRVKELEQDVIEEIENRDNREDWIDKLSNEIARYFDVDIGEHSSANNPWLEVFEAIPDGTINKFAIEKKIEFKNDLIKHLRNNYTWTHLVYEFIDSFGEQLRKEQE